MHVRRVAASCAAVLAMSFVAQAAGPPQTAQPAAKSAAAGGAASITPAELKDWLSYIASDELQGRQVFTEGLGLAGAYIADHLKEWGVKPGGDDGTYFQDVKVLGVDTDSHSSVTVTVNGQTRTFKDGEGVTFAKNQGGKQTITGKAAFVGYGLTAPSVQEDDYKGQDVGGRVVVYLGAQGPKDFPADQRRLLGARARNAIEMQHAVAAIGPPFSFGAFGRGGAPGRGRADAVTQPSPGQRGAGQPPPPGRGRGNNLGDFQTVQRLDNKVPPQITASDEFFDFLFGSAGQNYADLKAKAEAREPLPPVALDNVSITIHVDAEYSVVQTRLSRNVVGVVQGSDPGLSGHVRALRRALRSHRLSADASGIGARRIRRRRAGRVRRPDARDTAAWRHHQQRRRRRRVGHGVADGNRESVRHGPEAQAFGDVRLAHRRGSRPLRFQVHGRLSGSAAERRLRAAEHRHGRPQPLRRSEGREHGLSRGLRPDQHRAPQSVGGRERVDVEADDIWITR